MNTLFPPKSSQRLQILSDRREPALRASGRELANWGRDIQDRGSSEERVQDRAHRQLAQ